MLDLRVVSYGLTLHPDMARLVSSKRPQVRGAGGSGHPGKRTWTYHRLVSARLWGMSRRQLWVVKRRTAKVCIVHSIHGR